MGRANRAVIFQSSIAIALVGAVFSLPMLAQAQQAGAAQTSSAESVIPTIRTYTNLVVVDVVVDDAQGNPVHGLKASDFTLLENNKMQSIRHFEEHSQVPTTDIKYEGEPKLPAGLFTNKTAAPVNGPVNVLLLDYLNTPLTYQPTARKQLLEYLDKAAPGTRIAIFALTTKLLMLQGFTSDMSVLKNVLSKKGLPRESDIMADAINGGTISDTSLSDSFSSNELMDGMLTQEDVDSINRFQALATSFQQDMLAQYTLGAFDMLARYLMGMPGRKNVIWFSGGFPLDVLPNVNEADPTDSVVRNDELVRETDNLLTRAQVAMYPVDARGLTTDPALNFANSLTNVNANTGAATATTYMNNMTEVAQEHETMEAMAEDTGGKAFYNTNGLTQAVQKAVSNGSNYYTLTYSPTDQQWDQRFRSIKVKVDQTGVKLNYRDGYYAMDPNDKNTVNAQQAATVRTQPNTMATAMIHGGPDPAEILFKVRIRPADTPPAPTPLATNRTNPDPKVKVQGPYKSYGVDIVPDPKSMDCPEGQNGTRHCALEIWTYVYDSDGQLLVTTGNRIYRGLSPEAYRKLLDGGLAFHQEISVPVKGEHYLRTAIHEMNSDKVGAVEIPVAAVARLEPLKPLPAMPATTASTFTAGGDAATGSAAGSSAAATAATPGASASVPVTGTPVAPPTQNDSTPTLKRRTEPPANSSSAPAGSPTTPTNAPTSPN